MNDPDSKTRIASQEAAYWYIRVLDERDLGPDRRLLLAWLRRAPENVEEFLRIADADEASRSYNISVLEALHDRVTPQESARAKQQAALSYTYLQHLKAKNHRPKWALGLAAVGFVVAALLMGKTEVFVLSTPLLVLLIVFIAKELVLEYRVSRGFYASNAIEARDLIQFIIEQGDKLDFTDGSGLRRPALLSHPDDRAPKREDIPAGVTAK